VAIHAEGEARSAQHVVLVLAVKHIRDILKWFDGIVVDVNVTGFKAKVTWSQRLHDCVPLHEPARLHDKLGHGLCRITARLRGNPFDIEIGA